MKSLPEMIKELAPEDKEEVAELVRALLSRRAAGSRHTLQFTWEGALESLRGQYTSVELQHKALDWWGR